MMNHADYKGFAEDGILNIGYAAVMGSRSKIMMVLSNRRKQLTVKHDVGCSG